MSKPQPSKAARVAPRAPSSTTAAPVPPPMVFLQFSVIPLGDGTYRMVPKKPLAPVEEVGSNEAVKILGIGSRASLSAARDSVLGARLLKWRFTSDSQRKLLFRVDSLLAYREALEALDK